MKTTKRSKMLVSSIAMLLVALVALGSATYAWYSINTNVGANGFTVTASAPDGLEISLNASTGFDITDVTLDMTSERLVPSDLTYTTSGTVASGLVAEAANATSYAASTSSNIASGDLGNYYVSDAFYVRSASDNVTNVTVKAIATGTNVDTSYVKLAIVDVTDSTDLGAKVSNAMTTQQSYTSTTIPASNVPKQFVAIAWVDGTDPNCKTSTPNTNAIGFDIDIDIA